MTERMQEITDILTEGDFDSLLGRDEDVQLEAKGVGYDLDTPRGRFELAKDVVAFANSEGGHLLVGVATTPADDRDVDVLDEIRPVAAEDFPCDRYRGVIREYCYPTITGLDVAFVQDARNRGMGVITVPPQNPDRGPFVILRIHEAGEDLPQIVVGYVERRDSRNEPLSPKSMQQRLKKGSDSTAQRLGRMEDKLDQLIDVAIPADEPEQGREDLVERVRQLREEFE